MRERGILMAEPMVLATLVDLKTQTRRVCKNQPFANGYRFDGRDILCHDDYLPPSALLMKVKRCGETFNVSDVEGDLLLECPYGEAGDRLWVREAWRAKPEYDTLPPRDIPECSPIFYEATGGHWPVGQWGRYRHARFMPRWVSRILLELTSVRVEQLQAISEADAIAEGVSADLALRGDDDVAVGLALMARIRRSGQFGASVPIARYMVLWESINGPGSWDLNPYVWVVEFRRINAG